MAKKKINTRIVILDTRSKILKELLRAGDRLASIDEHRWSPCVSVDALDWRELVKAYKACKKK